MILNSDYLIDRLKYYYYWNIKLASLWTRIQLFTFLELSNQFASMIFPITIFIYYIFTHLIESTKLRFNSFKMNVLIKLENKILLF